MQVSYQYCHAAFLMAVCHLRAPSLPGLFDYVFVPHFSFRPPLFCGQGGFQLVDIFVHHPLNFGDCLNHGIDLWIGSWSCSFSISAARKGLFFVADLACENFTSEIMD